MIGGHNGAHLGLSSYERRALGLLNLGIAEGWSGDDRLAGAHLEDALALARQGRCDYLALGSLSQLAQLESARGGLRRAASLAREATTLAERHGWDGHAAGGARVRRAGLVRVPLGRPGAVGGASRAGLPGCSPLARASAPECRSRSAQARILATRGELEEAMRAAAAARQEARDWDPPALLAVTLAALEAGVLAAAGDSEGAIHTLDGAPNGCRWAELDLVRARLALADGDPAQALLLARAGARRRRSRAPLLD